MNKSLQEVKEEAFATGSCVLANWVHLVTGSEIISKLGADEDFDESITIPDALYLIQFGRNIFIPATDKEIEKILQDNQGRRYDSLNLEVVSWL